MLTFSFCCCSVAPLMIASVGGGGRSSIYEELHFIFKHLAEWLQTRTLGSINKSVLILSNVNTASINPRIPDTYRRTPPVGVVQLWLGLTLQGYCCRTEQSINQRQFDVRVHQWHYLPNRYYSDHNGFSMDQRTLSNRKLSKKFCINKTDGWQLTECMCAVGEGLNVWQFL